MLLSIVRQRRVTQREQEPGRQTGTRQKEPAHQSNSICRIGSHRVVVDGSSETLQRLSRRAFLVFPSSNWYVLQRVARGSAPRPVFATAVTCSRDVLLYAPQVLPGSGKPSRRNQFTDLLHSRPRNRGVWNCTSCRARTAARSPTGIAPSEPKANRDQFQTGSESSKANRGLTGDSHLDLRRTYLTS